MCFLAYCRFFDARRAVMVIETIVNDPEIGAIYKGVVTRLMNFGAFVEIAPGKDRILSGSILRVSILGAYLDSSGRGAGMALRMISSRM